MGRRGDNLFTAYKDMDKFRSLINIGFCNSSKRLFASLFIPGPDIVANHNVLNGFPALIQQDYCCDRTQSYRLPYVHSFHTETMDNYR